MDNKFNRNYRILWNESRQQWMVADELSSAKSRPQARSAISSVICAMIVAGGMLASAPEDALALTGTSGLAATCTGTAATFVATATGTCTATATDSIILANTGVINGSGTGNGAALTVDGAATGVTIDNSGTIHAGSEAYAIKTFSSSTATNIINQVGATIDATGSASVRLGAIHLYSTFPSVPFSGSISNSGTINANTINSTAGSIKADGIDGLFGDLTGSLNNTGTISAATTLSGTGGGTGMGASAILFKNISGTLTNSASMTATAINHATETAWTVTHVALGIKYTNLSGTLTNDGSITASASNTGDVAGTRRTMNVNAYGLFGFGSATSAASIVNNGTISATASNTRLNTTNIYIDLRAKGLYHGSFAGNLTNSNTSTISATATNSGGALTENVLAMGVELKPFIGSMTNDGSITASVSNAGTNTNFMLANGIYLPTGFGGNPGGILNNTGSITVSGSGAANSTTKVYNAGININNMTGLTINNSGSITSTPISGGSKAYAIRAHAGTTGNINNLAGGFLTGSILLTGTGAGINLNNAGLIDLPDNGVINTVSGNYTQQASGIARIGASSALSYAKLSVTGTADLTASNNIDVNVSATNTLAAGNILTSVVSGTVALSGTAPVTVTDNSAAVDFTAAVNNAGTGIDLTVIGATGNDVGLPTITRTGAAVVNAPFGGTYTDLGATANDAVDGNITANITPTSTVNIGVLGTYSVLYNVSDAAGNAAATVRRTVHVINDTTAPVITLNGNAIVNIVQNAVYADAGATALDNVDGVISGNITTGGTFVNTATTGSYTITYDVSDSTGNQARQVVRTVVILADTVAPVITLTGNATVNVLQNSVYADAGASASDNVDGVISANITTGGTFVDTATLGSFTITYDVSDASGNAATQVVRTVVVTTPPLNDTTPPVITLNGNAIVNIVQNAVYADAGATALDNVDGDLSGNIAIGGTFVDTATLGSFTITYDVSDASGNAATQILRTVVVTRPVTAGGGCTVNPNASFGTGTLLMLFAAGIAFFRRRKED